MTLRVGTVIAGSEAPTDEGVTGSVFAVIRVDGHLHRAILKRLPVDGVLAECFCGMLLRAYGLPCPEPILIRENKTLAFASLEVNYPSLKRRLGWDDRYPEHIKEILARAGSAIVCSWPDAPLALAIDEWIANADRNLGNFLWDGESHAYIDHERTLERVEHNKNNMVDMAVLADQAGPMQNGAVTAALMLDRASLTAITASEDIDFSGLLVYVEARLSGLAAQILKRFPQPQDLFYSLNS